jgi:ribonucleoside-diphosphate reductase alpha chain
MWTERTRDELKRSNGSVQELEGLSSETKGLFRTAWEIPMRGLIDMAADRGAFIDQSQSLNLFSETPNIGRLSSMYMYAWQKGIKTTYYLRSRPATSIAKTTLRARAQSGRTPENGAAPAQSQATKSVVCSLENPETCEACQ